MQTKLTDQIMYNALLRKDRSFEGIFWVGVKTTGIFCRPTCTARKPKKENVVFFRSCSDAMRYGFRPCKVCSPLEREGETPAWIGGILADLRKDPFRKFKDHDLRSRGIEPNKLRRWFKKYHGITFHGYQRMLRINDAFEQIKNGETVTSAAFGSGYGSLSGFGDSYKALIGASPAVSKGKNAIHIIRIDTPLGPMYAGAANGGICLLEFTDRRMLETEFKDLTKRLNAVIIYSDHVQGYPAVLDLVSKQMSEYFSGKRKQFTVPLNAPGTDFQQSVWEILRQIPYGTTRSYKKQAVLLGKPDAVRAVASANGHNRISIIIPCHRVIGTNGTLTGYGGGLWRKKWLLDFEKKNLA